MVMEMVDVHNALISVKSAQVQLAVTYVTKLLLMTVNAFGINALMLKIVRGA